VCLRVAPSRNGPTPCVPEHPRAGGQRSRVRVWDHWRGGGSLSAGAQGCPSRSSAAQLAQTPLFHLAAKPTGPLLLEINGNHAPPPKPKAELPAESELLCITWHGWKSHPDRGQRASPLSAPPFLTARRKAALFPSLPEVGQVTAAEGLEPPDGKHY